MSRFKDKVVVVTGGASGIGQATAMRLASEGAKLLLVDVDANGLRQAADRIGSGERCETHVADVSREEQVKAYVDHAVASFGRIDGFFNNAGIVGPLSRTEDYAPADFHRVLAINTNGVFYGMIHVLRVMREQGAGAIVNTSSVCGIRAVGDQSGYTASKHAVAGLTRNSAIEYAPHGIQINAIAPGAITTPLFENAQRELLGEAWEEAARAFAQTNPMKRFGRPEEVAALVAFLLSGEAGYINGAVIPIDGGQSGSY